jgi:hypothetical protein
VKDFTWVCRYFSSVRLLLCERGRYKLQVPSLPFGVEISADHDENCIFVRGKDIREREGKEERKQNDDSIPRREED